MQLAYSFWSLKQHTIVGLRKCISDAPILDCNVVGCQVCCYALANGIQLSVLGKIDCIHGETRFPPAEQERPSISMFPPP
jgi:hypothetical protein